MTKENKRYLGIVILVISFIFNIGIVYAKVDINIFNDFNILKMPKGYLNTFILLGVLFANLIIGLLLGDNIIVNFNRLINKEKITKSLIIEILLLLLIDITVVFIDIQTLSLCVKALAASLIFGPVFDNYQESVEEDKHYYDKDLSDEDIKLIDSNINREEIKELTYVNYKEIQKSYMYYDYNNLRKYVDDKLYREYCKEIKGLQNKNHKRIIKNINLNDIHILKIYIKNNVEYIDIYLNIFKRDYISDTIKKKIIKGKKSNIYDISYLITLSRNIEKLKCSYCNAPRDIKDRKCLYCDSKIDISKDFVICRKEYISKKLKKDNNDKAKEDKN